MPCVDGQEGARTSREPNVWEIWNIEPCETSPKASEFTLDAVCMDVTFAGYHHYSKWMRLRIRRCAQPANRPTHLALSSQGALDSRPVPLLLVPDLAM